MPIEIIGIIIFAFILGMLIGTNQVGAMLIEIVCVLIAGVAGIASIIKLLGTTPEAVPLYFFIQSKFYTWMWLLLTMGGICYCIIDYYARKKTNKRLNKANDPRPFFLQYKGALIAFTLFSLIFLSARILADFI